MATLSLVWLIVGLAVAALALAARLRPVSWSRFARLRVLGTGALAGLVGGWLGALVFGRYFGTPTALWFSIAVMAALPLVLNRLSARRISSSGGAPH